MVAVTTSFGAVTAHASVGTTAFAELVYQGNTTQSGSRTDVNPAPQSSAAVAGHGGSTAVAKANLSTGKLGVYTKSHGSDAQAHAVFRDDLTFTIAGANAGTVTPITVSWLVHGGFIPTGASGSGYGSLTGELQFGGWVANVNDYETFSNPDTYTSSGFQSASWTMVGADAFRFNGTYNLVGAIQPLTVQTRLTAYTYGSMIADFGNTASFSMVLPTQVSFTSGSGTFLSAAAAVPETGLWVMMIAGFAAIGGALRTRKKLGNGRLFAG